jgi:hypothetical protein
LGRQLKVVDKECVKPGKKYNDGKETVCAAKLESLVWYVGRGLEVEEDCGWNLVKAGIDFLQCLLACLG